MFELIACHHRVIQRSVVLWGSFHLSFFLLSPSLISSISHFFVSSENEPPPTLCYQIVSKKLIFISFRVSSFSVTVALNYSFLLFFIFCATTLTLDL